jgi:hypothetical protein
MADYKELIFSDDFKAYRRKQVLCVIEQINELIRKGFYLDSMSGQELKGALDMARKLLILPQNLIKDEKLQGELNRLIEEDITDLSAYLVRESLK